MSSNKFRNLLTDKEKTFYQKNGYLIIKDVLTHKECDDYISEAHKVVNGHITITPNIYRKSKKFLDLLRDQRIMDYADCLLNWRMIPIGDIFFFAKSENIKEQGSSPHQDNYFQKAEWGAFVACGVYLDAADHENGSLIVYPGTHWLGDAKAKPVPNFEYDEKGEVITANPVGNDCKVPAGYEGVQLVMGKGDIVFFHGHLIHWAPKNTSKSNTYRHVNYLKLIKNGKGFWPGWSERRELIERLDYSQEFKII